MKYVHNVDDELVVDAFRFGVEPADATPEWFLQFLGQADGVDASDDDIFVMLFGGNRVELKRGSWVCRGTRSQLTLCVDHTSFTKAFSPLTEDVTAAERAFTAAIAKAKQ